MLTSSRILAVSLLAALASARPTTLSELTQDQHPHTIRQATATVYNECSTPNTVAITFDDGPYKYNTDIVSTLEKYNAKATFFVNGDNWECIYSEENETRLKKAFDAGHQIASHTWAHRDLTTLNHDEVKSEMTRLDDALKKIIGVKPAFVRPPYGNYNELVREVAKENGQSIVIWDFDSGDSSGSSAEESKAAYDEVARKHPSTILALNHETYKTTAQEVLPYALQKLAAAGYRFVTVAECLGGLEPYHGTPSPTARDDSWTC
ncbi:Carbohydrate esterase 4 protein [Tulasnella sp. UAMH 9824]|nr:Carbohydrate esterase 4 protein [Tulasnella sp. UAMH 9824]